MTFKEHFDRFGGLLVVLAAMGSVGAGCAGQVSPNDQSQAASEKVRSLGIASYLVIRDPAVPSRTNVILRDSKNVVVGELDQEADSSIRFSFGDQKLDLEQNGSEMRFKLGADAGSIVAGDSGPSGDAQSLKIWNDAQPLVDMIGLIAVDVAKAPPSEITTDSTNSLCHHEDHFFDALCFFHTRNCNNDATNKCGAKNYRISWDACFGSIEHCFFDCSTGCGF